MPLSKAAKLHQYVPPDWYESSVRTHWGQRFWHRRRFVAVGKYSTPSSGAVLDIGSADGYFTHEIARLTGSPKVVGIDVLPSSVAYASARYQADPRFKFQVADAHKLPFAANKFSAVYCLEALEHVYHPRQVLREIFRVLIPHGVTIILVPAENWLFSYLVWPLWLKTRGRIWTHTHLSRFTHRTLPDLLCQVGFTNIQTHRFLLGMLLLVKAQKP